MTQESNDDLAGKFFELWQQHLSALAADPSTQAAMATWVNEWTRFATTFAPTAQTATPASAAPAAAALSDLVAMVGDCRLRLQALEQRLAVVEKSSQRAPRRPASRRRPAGSRAAKPTRSRQRR